MGRGEKAKRAAGAGWMRRSPHAWRHPRIFFCCPGALGSDGRRMLSPIPAAPRWFGGAARLHPSRLSPQQLPAMPQHPGDPWMRPHGRTAPGGARGARMSPGWGAQGGVTAQLKGTSALPPGAPRPRGRRQQQQGCKQSPFCHRWGLARGAEQRARSWGAVWGV